MKKVYKSGAILISIVCYFIFDSFADESENFFEFGVHQVKEGKSPYVLNFENHKEIDNSMISQDSIVRVELTRPLYSCKSGSHLSDALDKYLEEFTIFLNDSTNSFFKEVTKPFVSLVVVDEATTGSYFYFRNLNSFVTYNDYFFRPFVFVVERNGHYFLMKKSMLSNLEPSGTDVNLSLNLREIDIDIKRKKVNTKRKKLFPKEVIKRFSMFIPWRTD